MKRNFRTVLALILLAAALCGCLAYADLGRSWPPDEPKQTAEPAPQKPCTVIQNKDGTTGTSC